MMTEVRAMTRQTLLPPDNEARSLALDVTRSHHVEAPAGSGKTMLLVARFVKLLAIVRHPHEILALSFTNKAAGEMKSRIASLFLKAEGKATPANDLEAALLEHARTALQRHRTHRHLLLSPEGLQVMTFHGFCHMLAKRAPLEAGLPPYTAVLEEAEQAILLEESMKALIRELLVSPENRAQRKALEGRLLRLDNRLDLLVEELKELVRRRDLFLDLIGVLQGEPSMEAVERALSRGLESLVTSQLAYVAQRFAEAPLAREWQAFCHHLHEAHAENASLLPCRVPGTAWSDLPSWHTMADVLATKKGEPRKRLGPADGGFPRGFAAGPRADLVKGLPEEVTRLLAGLKMLPLEGVAPTDMNALADLIILVVEAVAVYERNCLRRHAVDFVGLEQAALRTLDEEHASDLQLFLDHRIQHLLVDEFQDTSRSQWRLVQQLCAGWIPGDGRTLFVVGDPKQSIYAFRKAEVRLFMEARKGIPLAGQGLLPVNGIRLEANFRSSPALVSWVNDFFARTVMADPTTAYDEVPFQPALAYARESGREGEAPVAISLFLEDQGITDPAEAEALWLAGTVREVMSKEPSSTRLGILLFARTRLAVYLKHLRAAGIPVRVKEGLRISQQPEVIHLYLLSNALCAPHDDLAWASLLRAPWSWVDAKRLLGCARLAPVAWPRKLSLAAELYGGGIDRLHRALESGRRRLGRDSLAQVVEAVWISLDGPKHVAAAFGVDGVANCRCFLEVLQSLETGIPAETLERLSQVLDRLYAPESPRAAMGAVELMTVHGAKGLEFDILFVPFLDWSPLGARGLPPYILERAPDGSGIPLIAMGPDRRLGESEPAYQALKKLKEGREIGEYKRLLYVAVTRAKRRLFLSGLAKDTPDGPKAPADSALAWLLQHAEQAAAPGFSMARNPSVPQGSLTEAAETLILPPPMDFKPEPVPYIVETPSELGDELIQRDEAQIDKRAGRLAALRGTVAHRLIESLRRHKALPERDRIAAALVAEGMTPEWAGSVAAEIEAELADCRKEPFFKWLMECPPDLGLSEWAAEAFKPPGVIQAGVLDFLRQDGDIWWIVDFKTSKLEPGEEKEAFFQRECKHYRPQLMAYRGMLSKAKGIEEEKIRTALYFTRLARACEIVAQNATEEPGATHFVELNGPPLKAL